MNFNDSGTTKVNGKEYYNTTLRKAYDEYRKNPDAFKHNDVPTASKVDAQNAINTQNKEILTTPTINNYVSYAEYPATTGNQPYVSNNQNYQEYQQIYQQQQPVQIYQQTYPERVQRQQSEASYSDKSGNIYNSVTTTTKQSNKQELEEANKKNKELQEQLDAYNKEKEEAKKNQEIEDEIEERFGFKIEEKDAQIADLQEAKEMLETRISELDGTSMIDILNEEEESRKQHLEQLKEIVKDNNDALSSETNKLTNLEGELNRKKESIGIIKKILMFFGGSEPKDITELREKIEKAKEQMKNSQQNVLDSNKELYEHEKDYLKFVKEKMTSINEFNKNRRNEIKQREEMMREIKNSKGNKSEVKKILLDQNSLNNEMKKNYIVNLRLNNTKQQEIDKLIKENKLNEYKQRNIKSKASKLSLRDSSKKNEIKLL